jgi:hypothetical protein
MESFVGQAIVPAGQGRLKGGLQPGLANAA